MIDNQNIKRKHARFPAFSDDTGVKITSSQKRKSFSDNDDWIITDLAEPPYYSKKTTEEPLKELRRSSRVGAAKTGQSLEQKEELKRHRLNLPDYSKRETTFELTDTGKKQLFGEATRQASYQVKEKKAETIPTPKREFTTRTPFKPKYVPASLIPEEEKSLVSDSALLASMKKEPDSYLLFDNEPAAYQEKKAQDPSVKKFHGNEVSTGKKRLVLDHSLDSLIETQQNEATEKTYFK